MGDLINSDGKADSEEPSVRALVVDDDLVIRLGLASLLRESGRVVVAGEAADGYQAIILAQQLRPDVVLMGIDMPICDGLYALPKLVKICKVLMLVKYEEVALVDKALRAGAIGYLVHRQFTADELITAVAAPAQGQPHLSPGAIATLARNLRAARCMRTRSLSVIGKHELSRREVEVMEHIARGRSNPDIARDLFLSKKTVKNHVNRIYAKLQVHSRAEAVVMWLEG